MPCAVLPGVPLRMKIIGIVTAPLLILSTTMAWWVRNELGGDMQALGSAGGVEALLIGKDGSITRSSGFPQA